VAAGWLTAITLIVVFFVQSLTQTPPPSTSVFIRVQAPLIVDAGLGLPSHACQVLEWGYDAVLLNTAVALAQDPVAMALAFAQAVSAGRLAWRAGAMQAQESAQASTPVLGTPFWHQT
jgi:thiazole synthase